jgi:NDP-sugar pyrophosphorylase family protein
MAAQHKALHALATLAVKPRNSSRQLLFNAEGMLAGRQTLAGIEWARQSEETTPLAFCGIHVISPRIFPLLTEEGVFSIIPAYLRLAAAGERIAAYQTDSYWRDLGKVESIQQAELELRG